MSMATDAGRAKRTEAQRAWKQAQLALNARLGAKQVAALHSLIERCMEDLTARPRNQRFHRLSVASVPQR